MSWIESMRKHNTEYLVNFWLRAAQIQGYYKITLKFYMNRMREYFEIISRLDKGTLKTHDDDILVYEEYEVGSLQQMYKGLIEDYQTYPNFMCNLSLIYMVSLFEYYICDIIKYIYSKKIYILKTRKKELDYETMLSFNTMEELNEYIIEKEHETIGHKSYEDIKKYFMNKFKIDFTKLKNENLINPIFVTRNIIVHNRGVVNEKFLLKVQNSGYKLGDVVKINEDYLDKTLSLLRSLNFYIDSCVKDFIGED
jgi:hypothetical protein